MRLILPGEDLAFQQRAIEWLVANMPKGKRPSTGPEMREYDLAWIAKQSKGGWGGISWPKEHGGCGVSPLQQLLWYEASAQAPTPPIGVGMVGLNFGGPTIFTCGTKAQSDEHLPRILNGETVWCQGFSEPNAGSDLGGIETRGTIHADYIEVTGQKIWTSYADLADYQLLLIRTDKGSSKHSGLTMVICDMKSEGVDVRPIQLISGESHFCEVFYDSVKIPKANVIGKVGEGWRVAMATLGFERGAAFIADQISLAGKVEELIALARRTKWPTRNRLAIDDDEISRGLAILRAEVSGLRAMTYGDIAQRSAGDPPGPEGSMNKLCYSDLSQKLNRLAFRILGTDALAFKYGDTGWSRDYFYSYASSVGGGTSEIQKEIIAQRVLELPRGRRS